MGCGKPFCTCCETSYAEGLADGFKAGFNVGYRRGHRAGYISGYLDGYNNLEPLPAYKAEILPLLPEYKPVKLLPAGKLACGCWHYCTCRIVPELPTYKPLRLGDPDRLPCGCLYTCTCWSRPLIPTRTRLLNECSCIGVCYCGRR